MTGFFLTLLPLGFCYIRAGVHTAAVVFVVRVLRFGIVECSTMPSRSLCGKGALRASLFVFLSIPVTCGCVFVSRCRVHRALHFMSNKVYTTHAPRNRRACQCRGTKKNRSVAVRSPGAMPCPDQMHPELNGMTAVI